MKHLIRSIFISIFIFYAAGCTVSTSTHSPQKLEGKNPSIFNNLQIGMSEKEVVSIIGESESTSVSHGAKLLHYTCVEKSAYGNDQFISYGVLFRDGEVLAFGRHTTFANDSVRWPSPKQNNN